MESASQGSAPMVRVVWLWSTVSEHLKCRRVCSELGIRCVESFDPQVDAIVVGVNPEISDTLEVDHEHPEDNESSSLSSWYQQQNNAQDTAKRYGLHIIDEQKLYMLCSRMYKRKLVLTLEDDRGDERNCLDFDLSFIDSVKRMMWRPADKPPSASAKRKTECQIQAQEAKDREFKYCELCREMFCTSKEEHVVTPSHRAAFKACPAVKAMFHTIYKYQKPTIDTTSCAANVQAATVGTSMERQTLAYGSTAPSTNTTTQVSSAPSSPEARKRRRPTASFASLPTDTQTDTHTDQFVPQELNWLTSMTPRRDKCGAASALDDPEELDNIPMDREVLSTLHQETLAKICDRRGLKYATYWGREDVLGPLLAIATTPHYSEAELMRMTLPEIKAIAKRIGLPFSAKRKRDLASTLCYALQRPVPGSVQEEH